VAAKRWPTTGGLVVSSSVKITESHGGLAYTPKVAYSYTVDSQSYIGDRIWSQEFADISERAHATAARYLVGAPVTVHYDPSAPRNSLLEPGLYAFSYLWVSLSLMGILVGAGLVYTGARTSLQGSVT
jgi:hypothetical protein